MNNSYIAVIENGNQIKEIDLETNVRVTIGRDDENKLVLRSSNVSRFHCVIFYNGNNWIINDLQSTNGIRINNKKSTTSLLKNGDVINIQPFSLEIHLPTPKEKNLSDEDRTIFIANENTQDEQTDRTELSTVGMADNETSSEDDKTIVPGQKTQNFIVVQKGLDEGASVSIEKTIIIGRAETCALVLTDPAVSRKHIEVRGDGKNYHFRNLSPENPVTHNGVKKESGTLENGDILQLANTELVVRLKKSKFTGIKTTPKKYRIIGATLFFLILLVTVALVFRSPKTVDTNQIEQNKGDNVAVSSDGLDRKRQLSLLRSEAERFAAAGNYGKAINRLEAYLQIVPDEKRILELLADYRENLATEEKRKADMMASEDEYKKKAENDLEKASEFLMRKDYTNAIAILNRIAEKKDAFSSSADIFSRSETIRSKVKEAQAEQKSLQEQEKKNYQTAYDETKRAYESGVKAYNEKNYAQAKVAWEKAAASFLDVTERTQAMEQLKSLEGIFKEKTEEDYNKGLTAYKNKDYKGALRYWNNVNEMYPDYKGFKADFYNLLATQVEKARHFYHTGLVYEGLNNMENALSNWQKALDELPVETSEYNRKARAKLGEYGRK